jgi:imipenem/basic amino acid-specific outer membrane pore
MKLVKMSLAAALLMGASAFAIDNTKVSGDAKVYYSTDDANNADLFNKEGAYAQAALGVGLTTDLLEGVSAGAHMTALSTLGLQGQLVNNVWEGTNGVDDYWWFDEAWMAASMGKTTLKAGRMALDTPLVFSEQWSIAHNTFEGAVLLNQDLPDTTLVAAYVGGSNGRSILGTNAPAVGVNNVVGAVNANGTTNFGQFYNGAYAFGVVNNSWKALTLQGWYYDATRVVQAYWLQADLNMEGLAFGAQYTGQEVQDATVPNADSQDAFAVKLGYEADAFAISGAYSATGDKGPINVGGNLIASGQSKLYTEAWWNYGYITQVDTTAFNVAATADLSGFGVGAYYTSADQSSDAGDNDMSELTLEVTKSFGPLDTGLYYIMTDAEDQNGGDSYNTVQAYLTLNF